MAEETKTRAKKQPKPKPIYEPVREQFVPICPDCDPGRAVDDDKGRLKGKARVVRTIAKRRYCCCDRCGGTFYQVGELSPQTEACLQIVNALEGAEVVQLEGVDGVFVTVDSRDKTVAKVRNLLKQTKPE